jgi:hypothetical protein
MNRFETLKAKLREKYWGFKIIAKRKSILMRLFYWGGLMFWWNPQFLDHVTTVIWRRVYMPERLIGTDAGYRILRHEGKHVDQSARYSFLVFALAYLFCLPTVFTFRSLFEFEAYEETMRAWAEDSGGTVPSWVVDSIAKQFTSKLYLWMCPFKSYVDRRLEKLKWKIEFELAQSVHRR